MLYSQTCISNSDCLTCKLNIWASPALVTLVCRLHGLSMWTVFTHQLALPPEGCSQSIAKARTFLSCLNCSSSMEPSHTRQTHSKVHVFDPQWAYRALENHEIRHFVIELSKVSYLRDVRLKQSKGKGRGQAAGRTKLEGLQWQPYSKRRHSRTSDGWALRASGGPLSIDSAFSCSSQLR